MTTTTTTTTEINGLSAENLNYVAEVAEYYEAHLTNRMNFLIGRYGVDGVAGLLKNRDAAELYDNLYIAAHLWINERDVEAFSHMIDLTLAITLVLKAA